VDEYWRLKSEGKHLEAGKLIGPACKDIVLTFFGGGALALKLGKGTKKLVVAGVKEGVALTETSYEAIKLNRTIKRVAKASDSVKLDHLIELKNSKVKFTPEDAIFTHKMPNGKIAFLEKGHEGAGLTHILRPTRVKQFESIGIQKDQIVNYLRTALTQGKKVGTVSKSNPRGVYEVMVNGKKQYIAIGISDNGYIGTAHPESSFKGIN